MSNRRRSRYRSASGPVVAGALFLAAMLIVFNALFLIASQHGLFFDDSLQRVRNDSAQRSEKLSAFRMSVSNQKMNLTLSNQGPQTIQLVSIWISEWTGTTANWHASRPLASLYIEPGQTVAGIGLRPGDLQNLIFNPALTYAMRIVTARGSVFPITYSPLSLGVSPGFINTGFLTISFEPTSFLYTHDSSCTPLAAWNVPGTSQDIVWRIQVINHGLQDITLYEYSSMAFIRITSTKTSSSFNQQTFFIVGYDSCHATGVTAYDHSNPSNPKIFANPDGDTQKGGNPEWVYFAAVTAGDSSTQNNISWNAPSEYMIFMIFYFRNGATDMYTQVIPFAGVNFA